MGLFNRRKGSVYINDEYVGEVDCVKITDANVEAVEEKPEEKPKDEEWVWVEGFKGMDKDMRCRDMQYEIGSTYKYDGTVRVCNAGYHFCLKLNDVLNYYNIKNGNRFFRVQGLVHRTDLARYGHTVFRGSYGAFGGGYMDTCGKLVAKEIVILDELTSEEIFSMVDRHQQVKSEKYYDIARADGLDAALKAYYTDELNKCGYSNPFVEMMIHMGESKIKRAIAVGNEPELNMDMKCWIIFKD